MAKVLLVEDDNNLREIFEMRLQAEGYETLSASDGEEALVVATQQKPDLIIADVMMPKLSGFEMLETLRAAPEMSSVKVIMMTALGEAEDQTRGKKLGVVKYLVKSQVTLEDFVRVVREVLPPSGQAQASTDAADVQKAQKSSTLINNQESEQPMQDDNTNPSSMPPADNPADGGAPANPISGGSDSAAPAGDQMTSSQEQNVVDGQVKDFAANAPSEPAMPSSDPAPATPPADPMPMGGDSGAASDGSGMPTTEPPASPPTDEPKPDEGGPATPPPAGM